MIIMLAGGMTVASSGMMPAAHAAANANLFVSAENSQFSNYMSGPQVIEVVVINSDINDTDEAEGEPIVTINGNTLRMVQATDGNWYGYFADDTQARIADSTTDFVGSGLDFGTICTSDTTYLGGRNFVSETVGVAVPAAMLGGTQSDEVELCDSITPVENISETGTDAMNVLREVKEINDFNGGQIGITPDVLGNYDHLWPFIQLYDLSVGGNVNVEYNPGSGLQSTSLTFDSAEAFASAELDRSKYPNNAQVHATITDLWLNIDPTDEDSWTFGTNATHANAGPYYQVFDENGTFDSNYHSDHNISGELDSLLCETNCKLFIDLNAQDADENVLELQDNGDSDLDDAITLLGEESVPVTITEIGPKSGIFGTYDESDVSVLKIASDAARDTSATLEYNKDDHSILVGFDFATIDIESVDDEWNSGEGIPIIIVDGDANSNSRADEDLDLFNPDVLLIPSISTGTPFTLGASGDELTAAFYTGDITTDTTLTTVGGIVSGIVDMSPPTFGSAPVDAFSDRAIIDTAEADQIKSVLIDLEVTMEELLNTINDNADGTFTGFNMFNYDVRSFGPESKTVNIFLVYSTENILDDVTGDFNDTVASTTQLVENGDGQGYDSLDAIQNDFLFDIAESNHIGLLIQFDTAVDSPPTDRAPIVADFFSYGFYNDGLVGAERIANQIIRIEAEESGDNTSTFVGTLEYIMINQLNINDESTYESISPIADDPTFIVIEDLTDEDSIRVNYLDLGADGVSTQIADQEEAPSHSGVVSFDSDSYKTADTVVITLDDVDLSVDSDLIDIYTVVTNPNDPNRDAVGSKTTDNGGTSIELSNGDQLGRLLDVTFDDEPWTANNTCGLSSGIDAGLGATGFSLVETTQDSGLFVGSFQIPVLWCRDGADKPESATGLDIEVNYVDFRDASGEIIEVGDSAGVRASTGSVSLDRTVYPVPFGVPADYDDSDKTTPTDGSTERSLFPIHQTGMDGNDGLDSGEFLNAGDLTIHIRVNDPDFNISASGEDSIAQNTAAKDVGPIKVSVIRGSDTVVLTYAGGEVAQPGRIDVDDNSASTAPEFGPIDEIAPDAGVFEADIAIRYTDGPASTKCPDTKYFTATDGTTNATESNRFDYPSVSGENYCILQGDILQVEYTDPADASGDVNTVTDSATFDLRNGVLQSDKSVYIIGSNMILTLIEADFDLDNDQAETYDLDLIEWDSDAATLTMGDAGGNAGAFDPEPLNFRETGDSTGIFQIVVEIPQSLGGDSLERGEEIALEYTDWGPSGSNYVGEDWEPVNLTIFTSNFGATVELDQKVYSWTDKVYITIVAQDHNFDGDLVNEIGNSSDYPIRVSTEGFDIDEYKLVETGTDTGIFTGEVILTGFTHDADGDGDVNDTNPRTSGTGPTDGFLQTDNDDELAVSFEFSEYETVVSSSLIRWNIGEVQWLEASYPASGTGVVRVIDPDMNLDPEAVDNFDVDVWSDSDAGGVDLTVTETGEATGIYEGTVFFKTINQSSGHRLRVSEGDTVTAEYEDHTLPYPYTTADEQNITATTLIGTLVPPPLDFEATVELDQKVYSWTDKVYITIVAPDHNADGNRVDEIGNSSDYPIRVSTEGFDIDNYKLVETGTDTGIFTGEVILTGFAHVTSITAGSNVIVDQLVPPATPPSASQEIEQDDLGVTNTGGIKFSIGGLDASTYYQYTTSKCDVANPDDETCSDFTFAKRSDSNGILVVIMAGPFTNLQYVFAEVKEIGKADPIYRTSFIVQVQGNAITNFESNASSNVIPTEPVIPVPTIPVPTIPVPTPVPTTPVPPTPVPPTPVPATPTLTQVTIASNNSDRSLAIPGNTITLSFTSSEPIETPTVTINGGAPATLTESNTSWSATKAITSTDPNGIVTFTINYSGLASNTSAQVTGTTDNSSVTVDKTVQPPITPSASQEIDENNLGVTNTGGIKFSIGGLDASTYYQYTTSKCDVANPDDETCSDFTFAKRSDSNGVLVVIMAGPFTSEQYVFADVKEIGKADPIYSTDFIVQVQNNGIFYFEPNVITS